MLEKRKNREELLNELNDMEEQMELAIHQLENEINELKKENKRKQMLLDVLNELLEEKND